MKFASRLIAATLALVPVSLAAQSAFAADPCGNFAFIQSGSIDCRIEVEGGCTAQCEPFSFEAGCTGTCTAVAQTSCVDSCGTTCIQQCDPALLDCFAGCHAECDEPTKAQCAMSNPEADCVNQAVAQCDVHCRASCEVPPSDCAEHCQSCCTGGCTTQANYDCDYDCFAELKGGCDVQCQDPSGALFCNGQYVHATDIEACIVYLADQGITVDVSARGTVTCDLNGCEGEGSAAAGFCNVSKPGLDGAAAGGASLALLGAILGLASRRRKNDKKKA